MSTSRGIVAITGANGTIGYACTVYALQSGYRVRCIVRREDAIITIKSGPSIRPHAEKVEFAVVPDNTADGAYDDAFKGAEHVVHIAGVWPTPNYHPDNEIYWPFVNSMENVLSAAEKSGSVKRIVFTQAGAGLVSPDDGDTLGTKMEQVLNESVKTNPQSALFRPPLPSAHHAYCGAKAYCMEHLKQLSKSNKFPFSIIQVIPGTVIGPSELVTSAEEASSQMDRMSKALLFNTVAPRYAFGFVHVQDCARVHIEALDEKIAQSRDVPDWFIAAGTSEEGKDARAVWKHVGDMVEQDFGEEVRKGIFEVGRENVPVNVPYRVDSRLTEGLLMDGKRFMTLEDCVREVAGWYRDLVAK